MNSKSSRPRVAVFKFASCDGCQLTLLDLEDELLALGEAVEICYFPEASRRMLAGPYDLGLVEGSVTTHHDAGRVQSIRRQCRTLVTLGACATSGGIQALRNWKDVNEFVRLVYPKPDFISTLKMSTPIAEHVRVDFELRGCPVAKHQVVELITAVLARRKPQIPTYPVCMECKRKSQVCLLVAGQEPCLGPVTQAGCGALCPSYGRPCYGCFGPSECPNSAALADIFTSHGLSNAQVTRAFRMFNAWSWPFRQASESMEHK